MRQPLATDVVAAVADQHGVCVRPFTMESATPTAANCATCRCVADQSWKASAAHVPGRRQTVTEHKIGINQRLCWSRLLSPGH